jgi:broad specificity phosphatase PhoE
VIARVADAHAGRAALIVSHGASLKIFVARVLGLATPGLRTFRVMTNTGVTVVERTTEGTYRLLVWNDVAHLHDGVAEALAGS